MGKLLSSGLEVFLCAIMDSMSVIMPGFPYFLMKYVLAACNGSSILVNVSSHEKDMDSNCGKQILARACRPHDWP
jgi:hypothetical protein